MRQKPAIAASSGAPLRSALRVAVVAALIGLPGVGGPAIADDAAEGLAPFGRLVSVGDHRLHVHCTGASDGGPTVLLEAGIGGNHLDWVRAQPLISRFARVCSYDRAGYGWSERGPKPRTVDRIVAELRALIDGAEMRPPFVLVGHSFGGLVGLYYASRFSDEVAGLVLVDSMHPDQYERFAENGVDVPVEPTRAVIYSSPEVLTYGIPPEHKPLAYHLAESDKTRSFMFNELRNIRASMDLVREAAVGEGLRSRVIVHGNREWDRHYRDGRMEDLWLKLQSSLARAVRAPGLVVAAGAGHQLPLDDPELVAKVVKSLLARLGRSGLPQVR